MYAKNITQLERYFIVVVLAMEQEDRLIVFRKSEQ